MRKHPFEAAGLGRAPFRFVRLFEATHETHPGHHVAGGTCDFCGTAIKHCCEVASADGNTFVVGRDCVRKVGREDSRLVDDMERSVRAKAIAKGEAKAAGRRAAWEAEKAAERARNGGLTDLELAERETAHRHAKAANENAWLVDALKTANRSDFVAGMIGTLSREPLAHLSDRAINILRDIYAKTVGGRRNSKAYNAAVEAFDDKLEESDNLNPVP